MEPTAAPHQHKRLHINTMHKKPPNEGKRVRGDGSRPWFGQKAANHNDKMHPRNLYRYYQPNFTALAREYPDILGKYVRWEEDRAFVDWRSPEATRAVTKTLLLHDLDIQWDMPLEGLCPPVPNRLNYICWLADLVHLNDSHTGEAEYPNGQPASEPGGANNSGESAAPPARGIDVGSGMSCIYPLLGHRVMGWSFLATDTSPEAVEWARKNVASNGWEQFIEVRLVQPEAAATMQQEQEEEVVGPLRQALLDSDGDFDFAMTNPPFWASAEEAGLNPRTSTKLAATAAEVACEGGELAFVTAIIQDSLKLGTRIRWYSSMVGRKCNLRKLLRVLREAGVKNVRTTEFFQGKTIRWGLAWSLTSEGLVNGRIPEDASAKVFGKKKARHSNEVVIPVPLKGSAAAAAAATAAAAAPAASPAAAAGKPSLPPSAASHGAGHGPQYEVTVQLPDTLPADQQEVADRILAFLGEYRSQDVHAEMDEVPGGVIGVEAVARHKAEAAAAAAAAAIPAAAAASVMEVDEGEEEQAANDDRNVAFRFDVEVAAPDATGAVQVHVKLHEGGDRRAFFQLCGKLPSEVAQQGRRWRRAMARGEAAASGRETSA